MEPLLIFLKPFLYAIPFIPIALFLDKRHNDRMREKYYKEFQAEQAAQAATQQPQPRQPKPGSAEDFERWKAEREKQQAEQ